MKSNPVIEAIAVFISLAVAASISIDVEESNPATFSMKTERGRQPVTLASQQPVQTSESALSFLTQP